MTLFDCVNMRYQTKPGNGCVDMALIVSSLKLQISELEKH
jgi:hypothetical protein